LGMDTISLPGGMLGEEKRVSQSWWDLREGGVWTKNRRESTLLLAVSPRQIKKKVRKKDTKSKQVVEKVVVVLGSVPRVKFWMKKELLFSSNGGCRWDRPHKKTSAPDGGNTTRRVRGAPQIGDRGGERYDKGVGENHGERAYVNLAWTIPPKGGKKGTKGRFSMWFAGMKKSWTPLRKKKGKRPGEHPF